MIKWAEHLTVEYHRSGAGSPNPQLLLNQPTINYNKINSWVMFFQTATLNNRDQLLKLTCVVDLFELVAPVLK